MILGHNVITENSIEYNSSFIEPLLCAASILLMHICRNRLAIALFVSQAKCNANDRPRVQKYRFESNKLVVKVPIFRFELEFGKTDIFSASSERLQSAL